MERFGKFCLGILLSLSTALCLSLMWKWLIVPLGIRAISVPHALGIVYMTALWSAKDPNAEFPTERVIYAIVFNFVVLLFGFLVHLAM